MKFDKDKIMTAVTADQVKVGDVGWYADSIETLRSDVEHEERMGIISEVREESYSARFEINHHMIWFLFYPAPYEFLQARWVKKNSLKIGDSVYINKGWKKGEKGFDSKYDCDIPICQSYWLTRIYDDCMVVATKHKTPVDNNHDITKFDWFYRNTAEYFVPYFAIEKVTEPTYAERQAEWVKENDLKIGDKIEVTAEWKKGDMGYGYECLVSVGDVLNVRIIDKTTIIAQSIDNVSDSSIHILDDIPYFAIKKVQYRPFANATEFEPRCEDWWVHRESNRILKATGYDWEGVWTGLTYNTYDDFHLLYEHRDTGEPAGVKV